jgi:RNA polymerase sigma factor (sigma-70 family)
MQDSLLSAFLHLKSFDGRSTFSTWLTRIGINSALKTLRRKRKYREVSAEDGSENRVVPEQADFAPNPEQRYAEQERARLVRKAIGDLRLGIRRSVELHALRGCSMKEMAGEIGVSVSAAKGRLYHAKIALRKAKALRNINDRDFAPAVFKSSESTAAIRERRTKVNAKSTQGTPSIVFCHGLWADGSCFSKVIPALQAAGHQVIAAQYGLDTTADDVATVRRTLGRVSSPAILVGHSYGGSVITGAGTDDRVAGLVYIAALAPDADETSQTQQSNFPKTDVFSYIEVADGRIWLIPEGIECFAGDLSEQEKKLVWATHFAPAADLFNAKVGGTAWRSKPSWYIVAKNDRTVHPDMQRFVAKRMSATTTEVASSHVPMLSHPDLVIDVIRTAANAARTRSTAG